MAHLSHQLNGSNSHQSIISTTTTDGLVVQNGDTETAYINLNNLSAVSILDYLLSQMSHYQASDLHMEPYKKHYRIRLRVDGLLHLFSDLTLELADKVISRIKVLARLNITKQISAQDGKFKHSDSINSNRSFRVSILPLFEGEKVVIRQVTDSSEWAQLTRLGFLPKQLQLLKQKLSGNQGLILVTGATGSGKSMTLYACLNFLNQEHKNICSVEDPVELLIDGVNQVQINEQAGFYFSDTLRSFLRQDPDAVMVGEIRDSETAQVAIKASQTGHLVLSSLHTSSGVGAVHRLKSLGIDECFIYDSSFLIIAQCLVRCLCSHCKKETEITQAQIHLLPELVDTKIYNAVGCHHCYKGFKGRIGAFELLTYNADQNTFTSELTLREVLLSMVKRGVTTTDELIRHAIGS